MLLRKPIVAAVSLAAIFAMSDATRAKLVVGPVDPVPPFTVDQPASAEVDVQVALLLDTSNSMDGLINQARTQLWTIVNEFNKAKRDGRAPRLQVAVYEYGNDSLAQGEGYVRQVVPFTSDLDLISEKLFALTTNGGSEFCGKVISDSLTGLRWSERPNVYRTIFIAGNEPFTQGSVDYREAVAAAVRKRVVVNTIHCGNRDEGVTGKWADGATRGNGQFMYIDQDRAIEVIRCPQDQQLMELSEKLNSTYLGYGYHGQEGGQRQAAQDKLALDYADAGAAVERSVSKASANYDNSKWDLVDAVEKGEARLGDIAPEALPQALRGQSIEEQKATVNELRTRREDLQQQIRKLSAERDAYLSEARKDRAAAGPETLDSAAVKIVREQMKDNGFDVAGE